jgi:hypothetical protein
MFRIKQLSVLPVLLCLACSNAKSGEESKTGPGNSKTETAKRGLIPLLTITS